MLLLGVGLFFSPIVSAIVTSSKTEYDISRLSIRNNVTVWNKPRKSLLNSNARLGNVSRVSRISTTMPWIYQSSYQNSLYTHDTYGMSNMIGNIKLMTLICQFKRVLCVSIFKISTSSTKEASTWNETNESKIKWLNWFPLNWSKSCCVRAG